MISFIASSLVSVIVFTVWVIVCWGAAKLGDKLNAAEISPPIYAPINGPYRTVAEIPQEPKPEPIQQPKREWKMPTINLGKHTKTFAYLMPVFGGLIGIGLLYDAPLLGVSLKWGAAVALSVMVAFFTILAIVHADS